MNPPRLSEFTSARVSTGRAGNSLPTSKFLELQLAHARARQAVHSKLDVQMLALELQPFLPDVLFLLSTVPDRSTFIRRPDWGRRLDERSKVLLRERTGEFDVVFIVVDGLSASAVQLHAARLLEALLGLMTPGEWRLAPVVFVEQGRVAIGDEIGQCLGSALSVLLIGERPGLSSPDSLGIYLTWNPHPGLTDANRNCISNVRADGLSYRTAAHRLVFLMNESRRRKLSGIQLKDESGALALPEA